MEKLITDPEEIRLQEQGEIQALLGRPTGWLTRWGITLVLAGITGLLVIGSLIRYPDIVEAPASIQTEYPPIRLEAKTDGRIEQLWAREGQSVDSGQLLVLLQSPVSLADAQAASRSLDQLIPAIQDQSILDVQLPQDLQLAALMPDWSRLILLLEELQFILQQNEGQRQVELYQQQIRGLETLDKVIQKVVNTLESEVTIAESNQNKFLELSRSGAASELEYDEAQTRYLRSRRELEASERDLINNRLEEKRLRSRIIALQQEESEKIKNGWLQLHQAVRQMQSTLRQWEDTYLLQAPLAGRVILSETWNINQQVNQGEPVLTIDPGRSESTVIARAELPVDRSGKVKIHQKVFLRLDAYPYKEFGVLEGIVQHIASIPTTGPNGQPAYQLKIALRPDGLTTSTGRSIPFSQEMRAIARIMTADRSFLARILEDLLSWFEEN